MSAGNVTCNRCLRLGRSCEFRPESRMPLPASHQRVRSSASHISYDTSSLRTTHTSIGRSREVSRINDLSEGIPELFSSTRSDHDHANYGTGAQATGTTAGSSIEPQDLLSIYSTSPVSAVVDNSAPYEPITLAGQSSSHKGDARSHSLLRLTGEIQSLDKDPASFPSPNEMKQLIHM